MARTIDCVVAGTTVLDVLVHPIDLERPIGGNRLFQVAPLEAVSGGVVCNAGTAMARLGARVAALCALGDDDWGAIVRRRLASEGIETSSAFSLEGAVTSTTAVLIAPEGERSFAHHTGASALLSAAHFDAHRTLWENSRCMLLGYYSLLPELEPEMAAVVTRVRSAGGLVALDAGGSGGAMSPLDRVLPHLDYYVPSRSEAQNQTGETDPETMLRRYREAGARGVLGLKLGSDGALLSPRDGELIHVPCATPPGPVVDTTGAGDAFYGGLLAGVLRGLELVDAAKLAAATAACCVTGRGASAGLRDYDQTTQIAGLAH
ncbi:MAG: carbohydrate kinase family protein [Lacipirellulaceae bacterium]